MTSTVWRRQPVYTTEERLNQSAGQLVAPCGLVRNIDNNALSKYQSFWIVKKTGGKTLHGEAAAAVSAR